MNTADINSQVRFLQAVLNKIPALVFLVDSDVRVTFLNERSAEHLHLNPADVISQLGGDALGCTHANDDPGGCGKGPFCKSACVVRGSVNEAFRTQTQVRRRHTTMTLGDPDNPTLFHALVTASAWVFDGTPLVLLTLEDFSDMVFLQGLLPICAQCKKIRDDDNYWQTIERYISQRTEVVFSHSLCPDCCAAAIKDAHRYVEGHVAKPVTV